MLGRFLRFGFNQNSAFEADLVLVIDDHVQEAAHVVQLQVQVGVQQRFIAFTTAPQHVVFATQLVRRVHAAFHSGCRIGKDVRIGVCGCARHPATVAEHVGCAPQQLGARGFLFFAHVVGDFVQGRQVFSVAALFGADVGVVPAIVGLAEDFEHLERDIGLHLGATHVVLGVPRAFKGLTAERVATFPRKAVPIGDGKAQVIFHAFAHDNLVGIVVTEAQITVAISAFVGDF